MILVSMILIEPVGIEMLLQWFTLYEVQILIEPVGIEMRMMTLSSIPLLLHFNRTSWN